MVLLPARKGRAVRVRAGETVKVVNTHGTQVVDTWAFVEGTSELMSMEHTRVARRSLSPVVGEGLYSNRRRLLLTVVADDTAGGHDTLCAACDPERYESLGVTEPHDNCTHNLRDAMAALGVHLPETPCPLNLFMDIPVGPEGTLVWSPPLSKKPGDAVTMRVETDLVLCFSCCPMDVAGNPINGNQPVRDCELLIYAADGTLRDHELP